jgi:XTP/dITP diphosphohydrolase
MSTHNLKAKELLAGTHNVGKVKEIKAILLNLPIQVCSLSDYPELSPVEETGGTYEENSKLKAIGYASSTGVTTLADDSGLEVDALGGLPGVKSARFGGEVASFDERIQKLLALLQDEPEERRTARFVCCLTLAGWDKELANPGREPVVLSVTKGVIEGLIISTPAGTNGFGYDPVFVPNGYAETMAQLPIATKNLISHRAKALAAMRVFIERWIGPT